MISFSPKCAIMLKLLIASTMQMMNLNVSRILFPTPSIEPWEVREMIDVLYGNNQGFWCTSCIGICSLLHLQKLKTQEEKHLRLHCASTKSPFPVSLQRQLLALTRKAKEKNRKQRRIFLCC